MRLGMLLATVAASAAVLAQTTALPQTPIRLIVPFTPGTGIDLIARTVGPRLSERLGRPVVVDNRAGASGNIGTEAVVRAGAQWRHLVGHRQYAGDECQPVSATPV